MNIHESKPVFCAQHRAMVFERGKDDKFMSPLLVFLSSGLPTNVCWLCCQGVTGARLTGAAFVIATMFENGNNVEQRGLAAILKSQANLSCIGKFSATKF